MRIEGYRVIVLVLQVIVRTDAQGFEGVILVLEHLKSDIVIGGASVTGCDGDTHSSVHAGRSGDGDGLELIMGYRFNYRKSLHRRTDRECVPVLRFLRIEALQRHTAYGDTGERGDLGFLRGENDLVDGLVGTVSCGHFDFHRSVHYTRFEREDLNRLGIFTLGSDDLWQLGCTHHQVDVIRHVLRIEGQDGRFALFGGIDAGNLIADHLQICQMRIRGRLFLEVQFIHFRRRVTRRRDADLVLPPVHYVRRFVGDSLFTCRISGNGFDGRHIIRRDGHLIDGLSRRETRDRFAVHEDGPEGVILEQSDRELHRVGLLHFLARRGHYQRCFARRRGSLGR